MTDNYQERFKLYYKKAVCADVLFRDDAGGVRLMYYYIYECLLNLLLAKFYPDTKFDQEPYLDELVDMIGINEDMTEYESHWYKGIAKVMHKAFANPTNMHKIDVAIKDNLMNKLHTIAHARCIDDFDNTTDFFMLGAYLHDNEFLYDGISLPKEFVST